MSAYVAELAHFPHMEGAKYFVSWNFLKDPIAVCIAAVIPLIVAVSINQFDVRTTFNYVYISTTVLLIMLFGTAEKILVSTVYRVVGTLFGVGVGILLAFGHGELVKRGANHISLYVYQLVFFIFIVFLVAFLTRLFPHYYDMFLLFAVSVATLIFSADLTVAYSRTLSVLIAAVSAALCTIIFQYTRADHMLFKEHRDAAANLFELCEYAISSEHREKHEFDHRTHQMRMNLNTADMVWDAYETWYRITCRKPKYDFDTLSHALRPLYYEVFSLYWSHVETNLRPRDATRLYCDSDEDYNALFRPLIQGIVDGIRQYRSRVNEVLNPTCTHESRRHHLEFIIGIIGGRFYTNLQLMNIRYLENRLIAYSTRIQRWNMTDYMVTVACVIMELVDYTRSIVELFSKVEPVIEYMDQIDRLAVLRNRINELRFETHTFETTILVSH
jgi:hypothetical protein